MKIPAIHLSDSAMVALRATERPSEETVLRLVEKSRLDLTLCVGTRMSDDVEVVVGGIPLVMDRVNAGRASEISIDFEKGAEGFRVGTAWHLSELTNGDLGFLAAPDLAELLPNGSARGRVLLADEDDAIVEYLTSLLENVGLEVATGHDPAEAEATLNTSAFSLVLIDFMVNRTTGLQALAQMSATTIPVPIVLFTSDRGAFELASADKRIRLAGWLPKPFDLATELAPLLASLATW